MNELEPIHNQPQYVVIYVYDIHPLDHQHQQSFHKTEDRITQYQINNLEETQFLQKFFIVIFDNVNTYNDKKI